MNKDEIRARAEMYRRAEQCDAVYVEVYLADVGELLDALEAKERELAEYRTAEEQGLLIRLPCKVCGTVYKVSYDCSRGIRYNPFDENGTSTAEICLKCEIYPCDLRKAVIPATAESEDWIWKNRAAFGKTVFLTREEAQAALEGQK